ncbi:MAG: transglutaminase domain protein [Proteobacteria bacterium]|nr:transglutaminase domain protein [Pseudomonadota bacterium]
MNQPLPSPFDSGLDVPVRTGDAPAASVRMQIDCRLAYQLEGDCEFVFLIHVALDRGQSLVEETLHIEPPLPYRSYTDEHSGNRFMRLSAGAGALTVSYHAVVDRVIDAVDPHGQEVAVRDMPDEVLRFVLPTRYCESDLLGQVAQQMFGALPGGYSRVRAICDWVHDNVSYRIGSTNATTTARDVFLQRTGVCRDYAHLAVTFCRALNIPARLVSAYAHFDEPPPDFHAIFEAYLGGRWVLFDPSGMAPVHEVARLATGRDAKDVAFATIFGPARMVSISPELAVLGPHAGRVGHVRQADALPG